MNIVDYELKENVQVEHTQNNSVMNIQNDNNNFACPRKGEHEQHVTFRAQRLFSIGADWYFSTREDKDQGPFTSKEITLNAIKSYISKVQS